MISIKTQAEEYGLPTRKGSELPPSEELGYYGPQVRAGRYSTEVERDLTQDESFYC